MRMNSFRTARMCGVGGDSYLEPISLNGQRD